jgi:hypothetical protein
MGGSGAGTRNLGSQWPRRVTAATLTIMSDSEWWERVPDLDRPLLLNARDQLLLPAEVITIYQRAGGPPLEPVDGRPGRFRWPAQARAVLNAEAAVDPDCE